MKDSKQIILSLYILWFDSPVLHFIKICIIDALCGTQQVTLAPHSCSLNTTVGKNHFEKPHSLLNGFRMLCPRFLALIGTPMTQGRVVHEASFK